MSRLPDFLIIGAMKSGTTSLYEDLVRQPAVYFPPGEKEPHVLVDDRVLAREGRKRYEKLYRRATPGQVCGDSSTGYTKRPEIEGVAPRAKRLLGPDVKAIYLVREPLARAISQHYHHFAGGSVPESFDEAVYQCPQLIAYSRYAYQLRPWFETFGEARIRVIRFEDYIEDRLGTVRSVCQFLGVEAYPGRVRAEKIFGRTEERSVPKGALWRLSRSRLYRFFVREHLPEDTRERLRRRLLPKPPSRPPLPSESALRYIAEKLAPEVEELQRMTGSDVPFWDLEEAIRAHREKPE